MSPGSLSYYVYRFFGAVMPHVPPRLGYAIFDRVGSLSYQNGATARENVHDNLRHVLGPQAKIPGSIAESLSIELIFCGIFLDRPDQSHDPAVAGLYGHVLGSDNRRAAVQSVKIGQQRIRLKVGRDLLHLDSCRGTFPQPWL